MRKINKKGVFFHKGEIRNQFWWVLISKKIPKYQMQNKQRNSK